MFKATREARTIDACVKYPITTNHISQRISINGKHWTINGEGQTSCDKNDKFDKMFGVELAGVRAEINMLKEYEKILIKMTKQPEWRKEPEKYLHHDGGQVYKVTKEEHEALHSNNPNLGDFRDVFETAMSEMQKAVSRFNKRFGIKE